MSPNYCEQNFSKRLFKSQAIVNVSSSHLENTQITSKSGLIICIPLDSSLILIFLGISIIFIVLSMYFFRNINFRNTTDESRKIILNIQTFISTGSGALSSGDILGTMANNINKTANNAGLHTNIQELKQLLKELKIEIEKENLLAEEFQKNILNQLQLLLDTEVRDSNDIDTLKKQMSDTRRFLEGTISDFPADSNLVLKYKQLLSAIKQKIQQI